MGSADAGLLDSNPIFALAIIFAVAMLTSMVIAVLLERIAYRKLRNAPRLVPLITAIGASLFLQYAFRGLYGSGVRSYPNVAVLDGTSTSPAFRSAPPSSWSSSAPSR